MDLGDEFYSMEVTVFLRLRYSQEKCGLAIDRLPCHRVVGYIGIAKYYVLVRSIARSRAGTGLQLCS